MGIPGGNRLDATDGAACWRRPSRIGTDFSGFRPPALNEEARRAWVEAQKAHARPDQYLLASLQLSGFTVMTFLRGFAALMEDFYEEPELAARLADLVFGFETRLIEFAAREGFHGIAFSTTGGPRGVC